MRCPRILLNSSLISFRLSDIGSCGDDACAANADRIGRAIHPVRVFAKAMTCTETNLDRMTTSGHPKVSHERWDPEFRIVTVVRIYWDGLARCTGFQSSPRDLRKRGIHQKESLLDLTLVSR